MTPPRPKSNLGDRVVVNDIVEVSISLATVMILETMGVLVPPGAFIVEKLPTRELIVPTLIVEAVILLMVRALGITKLETLRVDVLTVWALTIGEATVRALKVEMAPDCAWIVLTTKLLLMTP
jgi:hypothetical protein